LTISRELVIAIFIGLTPGMAWPRRDAILRALSAISLVDPVGTTRITFELGDRLADVRRSQRSLVEKIEAAQDGLNDAARVIAELQDSLASKVAEVEQAQTSYERYSRLAEVEEQRAAPLLQEIEGTLDRHRWRERGVVLVIHLLVGSIFFLIGFFVGGNT
jgi:hypothetical protein